MTAGQPGRGGVIFDVDGTLLDTNYLHVAAWWEAFRERGHDIRCADVDRALGTGSAELVERVLGQPDPLVIDAHSRYFAPYLGRMRALPGAPDLLAATADLGLQVVLATSAKDDEVDLMLDAIGARDVIGTVVSSGAVERSKPDPDIVERALSESGTDRRGPSWSGTRSGTRSRPGGPACPASGCSAAGRRKTGCAALGPPRCTPTLPRSSQT